MPSATQHPPSSSNPRNRRPGDPEQASPRWPRPSASQSPPRDAPLEYQRGTGPLPPLPQPGTPQPSPQASAHPRPVPAVPSQPPRATQPPSAPRRQTAAPAPQSSRSSLPQQAPQMPVVAAAGVPGPGLATTLATNRHNPRVRAAICYALPFIPALSLLLRERRNGFIRMH